MLTEYSHKWRAFIGVAMLSFGCYLDYTVVNIALPTIQQQMHIDLSELQWIMNIYFLALCILATIMGRFGDLYGRRRIFYIGVVIFLVSSIIAGVAMNIDFLILGRFLQGVGAAIVLPLGPSILPESFPKEERGKSIGYLGSVGGIALALGPVLGGIIVTYLGWRWIFFINIPIVLLGCVFCMNSIRETKINLINSHLDWPGMILLALTMGGIVLSLMHSQAAGWINTLTLIYLLIGIISAILLVKFELTQDNPLIEVKDFSNLIFFSGAGFVFVAGALSAVALFFDPLYLQIIRGQSPELSGLILFAIPAAVLGVAPLVGHFVQSLGLLKTILCGLIMAAIATLMHVFYSENSSFWYIIISFIILGSMWALGNTVPIIAAQTVVKPERVSAATGTIITMFNVGGSMGLAIAVVIYHHLALNGLFFIAKSQSSALNAMAMKNLRQLIADPAQSLLIQVSNLTHTLFHYSFMHGFMAVMIFACLLPIIFLLGIIFWEKTSKEDYYVIK